MIEVPIATEIPFVEVHVVQPASQECNRTNFTEVYYDARETSKVMVVVGVTVLFFSLYLFSPLLN